MPTGYTAFIENGQITTAKDFIMLCARAFGATVIMKDEPLSKPIPEVFSCSNYYSETICKLQEELKRLQNLTLHEAQEEADDDYKKRFLEYTQGKQKDEKLLEQYNSMEEEIRKWVPPTYEHQNLKDFAINQIEMSKPDMEFWSQLQTINRQSATEWLETKIADCKNDIEWYRKLLKREEDNIASKNKWLKDLRNSLNEVL